MATTNHDWADLVKEAEGEAFDAPTLEYEFSNGRRFYSEPVVESPMPVNP